MSLNDELFFFSVFMTKVSRKHVFNNSFHMGRIRLDPGVGR